MIKNLESIEDIIDDATGSLMISLKYAVKTNNIDWIREVSYTHSYMCGVKGAIIHLKDKIFNEHLTPLYIEKLKEYLHSIDYNIEGINLNEKMS